MREVTIYEAYDGARFNSPAECLAHEDLVREVRVMLSPLGFEVVSLPDDRYVQHVPIVVQAVRIAILRKAGEVINHHWFPETIERAEAGEYVGAGWGVGRLFDEYNGPLTKAWRRVCVIDPKGREWNQPYYVEHTPDNATEWVRS